ncbi:hypothetical protein D910_06868 [Dendroctonus ponderosae]|uniref:AB hydrolase-1 domain-containing protein n=1 Tax=Dendroctonus ponderosae TaxID=77166 RepID=U4U8W7_DENPD|nr:hypothetical protein D910_06868 [Dendroctonus ponderosae]
MIFSQKRRYSQDSSSPESDDNETAKERPVWQKILIWSLAVLFIILFLVFLLIWVVVPIIFWTSISFQRFMIFYPIDSPKDPQFDDPEKYGIDNVYNTYITVRDYYDNNTLTQIGAWLILPENLQNSPSNDVSQIIRESQYDLLVFLHGVYANRAKPIAQYKVFRKKFLVLAIDHRGYGDSGSNVQMLEHGMINDHLQIYDWILAKNFTKNIYYWGHSLGGALSCHIVRALKERNNAVPTGLILESTFTTLVEAIENNAVGKIYSWLAYFNATILNPLDENGFHFYSTTHILHVDCPIMILHAEDDGMIPSALGEKLANISSVERDSATQGSVTTHIFSSDYGYGHNYITSDTNIPQYIEDFKEVCESFTQQGPRSRD